MEAKQILDLLKQWGNYNTYDYIQIVQEEIELFGTLKLRSVDRRSHIEVIEIRRGQRVAGKFVPGNIHVGNYDKNDKYWQAKALVIALKNHQEQTTTKALSEVLRCLYEDESGRKFLINLIESLKSENDVAGISRIVTARMFLHE